MPPQLKALKGHVHGVDLAASARQLVGTGAGTWAVRVGHLIHGTGIYVCVPCLSRTAKYAA